MIWRLRTAMLVFMIAHAATSAFAGRTIYIYERN